MKKDKETELLKIIDALYECYFDELGDEDSFEENVVIPFKEKYGKEVNHISAKKESAVKYACGATKGVLIFENLGFVIKIPFIYDEYGEDLRGAYLTEDGWNYCEQEEKIYNKIEEPEFKQMFLKTEKLTNIHGFPIYIQDYADSITKNIDKNNGSSHSQEDNKRVDSIIEENDFSYINTEWEADVLTKYGKEFYIDFKKKISKYEIDDLRGDNVGYKDGMPVIIDYAGFFN